MSQTFRRIGIVVVGIGIMAGLVLEGSSRFRAEARYQKAVKAQHQLEGDVASLQSERDRLYEVLKGEQRRVDYLTKQVASKETQLQDTVARMTQGDLLLRDVKDRLQLVQTRYDDLQEEMALAMRPQDQRTTHGKVVRLEKVIVSAGGGPSGSPTGRVISVHPEWRFVVVDLGWKALGIGDVVSIYRKDQLMGKARVERVQEGAAAASLLPEWANSEIRVDDIVRAL